jgi:polyhydroxyalkanoate synthesis repressor PhaR
MSRPEGEAEKPVKVIKRYANRKLYDTERSCYVTLDEISLMIKEGEDVQVVDNKSKEDLTAVTLAQIIVEEEKKVAKMPLKLLRSIIQSSNDALGDFYQKNIIDPAKSLREDVAHKVDGIFRRDGGKEPAKDAPKEPRKSEGDATPESSEPHEAGPVRAFVSSTSEAFETWQKRIDEQVRETVQRMSSATTAGSEVEILRKRVRELEERLASLEGATRK